MMIGASHLGVLSVALNVWRGDVNTPARIGSGLTAVDIELMRGSESRLAKERGSDVETSTAAPQLSAEKRHCAGPIVYAPV